jgi:23S rRNA-/tRNA-specific pseudouridylate synthase
VGDRRYGGKEAIEKSAIKHLSRLCLWAMKITLSHPKTNKDMTFEMDEPEWLSFVLRTEEEQSSSLV